MASRVFPDSWKRIERAVMHAQVLVDEWNSLLNPEAYRTEIHMEDQWTGVARAVLQTPPKNDLALELGEFFYQLRAALDGAFYKMTVSEGGGADPPANEYRVEFPIYHAPKIFNGSACNTGPLPQNLKIWLESVQPYNAGKAVDANTEEFIRVLTLLHDCARKDRHRKLHILAAVSTHTAFKLEVELPRTISFVHPIQANFLNNETEFLRFGVTGPPVTLNGQVQLTTGITIEVAVKEIPGAIGVEVGNELKRMVKVTQAIIQIFEDGYG